MSVLITRPRYDEATYYLFAWAGELVKEAKMRGGPLFDLKGVKANRKTVASYLAKMNPDVVIFNGHGDAAAIMGHDDELLISTTERPDLLRNTVVYFRACNAGRALGPAVIVNGANGFVGYRESFMFPYDEYSVARPLDDERAKPCLECSNRVGLLLVKGCSAREAHEGAIEMARRKIDEMLTSKVPNTFIAWFLHWNMINQVYGES